MRRHRITVAPETGRVRVLLDGEVVADTTRAVVLSETGLPDRRYLPPGDVRMDLLEPSATRTRCPFKGRAVYWTAVVNGRRHEDVAWSYPDPIAGRADIAGLVCFYDERVSIRVDGLPDGFFVDRGADAGVDADDDGGAQPPRRLATGG